ncbi:hypothetical protein [Comamonas sp. GB3 AK4-5]|uniref:hypothetical protein n=1 Tax=Comamonas sp. GB3 AK4-5 TaxID=3231487 RepID=UPI00351E1921
MRGKSLTRSSYDLPYLFFKIRCASPGTPERRSWQRRARIALAALDWLTPAERHEIACVWSRSNVSHIDSPALRKFLAHSTGKPAGQALEGQKPCRRFMRAGFNADGSAKRQRRCKVLTVQLVAAPLGLPLSYTTTQPTATACPAKVYRLTQSRAWRLLTRSTTAARC